MTIVNIIVISLTVLLLFGVKSSKATVSCADCPGSISINLATDVDLNTQGCTIQDDEVCSLVLRIDYTNSNNSFALISGSPEPALVLTNGEPVVTEITFIWFNELRFQRMANILCFSGASCGFDLIKHLYKDKYRLFDYRPIQSNLTDQLYSSSAPSSSLTCVDPSGSSVSCTDGFCRSIFDGNGFVSYSSCVKKGLDVVPYGLTVSRTTMADLGGEQITIIFTCNKPMCNSKENTQKVLQKLISAQIIPQSMTTTTPMVPLTTVNLGIKTLNNKQKPLVSFLLFFSMIKILN